MPFVAAPPPRPPSADPRPAPRQTTDEEIRRVVEFIREQGEPEYEVEIKEKLESAEAVFVTEYRGLTVGQQQELRRSLAKAEAEYKVFKMSLARRAAEESEQQRREVRGGHSDPPYRS